MNIIQMQREQRLGRIAKLRATLKKAFDKNLSVDYEQLISQACLEWGSSRRYLQELLQILKIDMAFTIENKQIIPPDRNLTAPDTQKELKNIKCRS